MDSDEYLDWLIHGYDKNGVPLPFMGIRYCTDDENCKCRQCKQSRRNKWPYTESLSANLLYISGFKMHEINNIEIKKLEDCLFNDFNYNINGFFTYVTDLCTSYDVYGIHILNLFRNGSFNKKLYNGATPAILAKCYSNLEKSHPIMNHYYSIRSILQKKTFN
ncbi:unnamed protein product [Rotaria magnacalcarata]|uniref:Uncharacterized protein n=1 Tax=Rotaria magnacalcarata TaxID=392030 RepID=A0A815UJJ0_9BILA|nr:unnamed protein product [Rotaria magnacalcarata]CAF1520334.1 unnamed protein product [Rotaria magnacalcarata]CAF2046879.1 unnamed protein product [Rotaria magnacalcarata]CAF3756248.1 unnamed protein product [Rotaria magnacalcarata]CAF3819112.1 unnamed protein product [Rotaria magnacalcarata]